jgi:glycosyltransferase involved in cell wall biosynthesis
VDFINFVPDYWGGPRHNRHYFCLELAKKHKVLFVSPPFSIERLLRRDRQRHLPESGTVKVATNLWSHVAPKWLFTNFRFPWLDRLFRRLRMSLLKRKLSQLDFRDPVLILWHPQYLEMLDAFPGATSIYYIYDHLSGYTGSDPSQRSARELELIRRVDMVFVLSRKLLEENQKYNSNTSLLPNAVDFELFAHARDPATVIPDDLAVIPHPRIGYVGSLNEKVDIDLLEKMAVERPEWSIVLIGRENFSSPEQKGRFDRLIAQPNVHWIPYRAPEALPAYLKGLDVCMMCYVINGWTYFGDPSKMHEYLAAGKPTVGTPLASIVEYQHVIEVPESHDEWLLAIERCLQNDCTDAVQRRIAVAAENSYSARIARALALIEANTGSARSS